MRHAVILGMLVLAAGCPKSSGSRAASDPAIDALSAWTRAQLDLRAWRSCARAALDFDLETAEVIFPIAADGTVGTVAIEPAEHAHDPSMICLQMELARPPESVPASGEARTVRLGVAGLHEVPGSGG